MTLETWIRLEVWACDVVDVLSVRFPTLYLLTLLQAVVPSPQTAVPGEEG